MQLDEDVHLVLMKALGIALQYNCEIFHRQSAFLSENWVIFFSLFSMRFVHSSYNADVSNNQNCSHLSSIETI